MKNLKRVGEKKWLAVYIELIDEELGWRIVNALDLRSVWRIWTSVTTNVTREHNGKV